MSNSIAQGVYAPLPQSISDSDSEEELHSSINIQTRKIIDNHAMNGQLKEYHHLDDAEDGHINGFPNIDTTMMDDIPIIKDGYKQPMSNLRMFFFIFSIVVCFLTIIIFLWVLPCSENATCLAVVKTKQTSNWEKPYLDIELMGPINVVEGASGRSKNLVFIFRKDIVSENSSQMNALQSSGGAISIIGDSGKVAWFLTHPHIPTDIDCKLLDVDKNGQTDCLVSGDNGLLTAINPLYGHIHWYAHSHTGDHITSIQFPVVISDVNGDGINDLLTIASLNGSQQNYFIVISGLKGNILSKTLKCTALSDLKVDREFIDYLCYTESKIERHSFSVQEFFEKLFNRSDIKYIPESKHFKHKMSENEQNNYIVEGRQLIVQNLGHCPNQCNVSVQLIDQRSGKQGNITWAYKGVNMYGMVPTIIKFKESKHNLNLLQGHINGFILKFWQWCENKSSNHQNSVKYSIRNLFNDVIKHKITRSSSLVRNKRDISISNKKTNLTEHFLLERLVLITFNSTNFNIVNASQSEVTQLCTSQDSYSICQPNLTFQENSVLVADLDKDGSQELITYLSTFVYDETEQNKEFKLQSNVKVIRLENELPKLYEAVYKP